MHVGWLWPAGYYKWPLATASLPPLMVLPDLHIQPFDLLVKRRERDAEAVGGFGLVPAAFFQHVADDTAFAVFDDVEQRGVGRVVHHRVLAAAADQILGQQIDREAWSSGQ